MVSCFVEPKKENPSIAPEVISTNNINNEEKPLTVDSTMPFTLNDTLTQETQKEVQNNSVALKTLEYLLKMKENEFVDWCIENQYVYDELKYYKYFNVLYYKKSNISSIGFSISKSELSKPSILYQTNNEIEYNSILQECNNSNYNFIRTEPSDVANSKVVFEIYASLTNEISFYLSDKTNAFKYNIAIKEWQ